MNQDLASIQSRFFDPIASISNGRSKRVISVIPDSEDIQPGKSAPWQIVSTDDIHFNLAILVGVDKSIRSYLAVHWITVPRTGYQSLADRDNMSDAQCFEHACVASVLTDLSGYVRRTMSHLQVTKIQER